MKKLTFLHTAFCLTTMAVAALSATSCADDIDINNNNSGKGNALTLKLNTANYHQDADARITRVINAQAPNGQNIKVVETDYNFIEDNITPVAALTRGTMYDNIDAMPQDTKFGIYGYSSATSFDAIGNTANFINNGMAGKDGKVTVNNQTKNWDITQKYMKIAGTYPSTVALTKSGNDYSFSYTPDADCLEQKDVMVGMTQAEITNLSTAPSTNLTMHHALTAVNFAVGEKLKLDGLHIKGIEVKNAVSQGTCKTTFDNTQKPTFTWTVDNGKTNGTFNLKFPTAIEAKTLKNTQITGVKDNNKRDNYTFLMVPMTQEQVKKVEFVVYLCNDKGAAVAPLTIKLDGQDANEWKAGHTITYTLTTKAFENTFKVSNNRVEVNKGATEGTFTVTSFHSLKTKTKQDKYSTPIAWKVVKYKEKGQELDTAPAGFSLDVTSGKGGVTAATVKGTFDLADGKGVKTDYLTARNKKLKEATEVTQTTGTNLAGKDGSENTANCYIVSAGGTYRLPLAYGNALKNGKDNTSAYTIKGDNKYFPTHNYELCKNPKTINEKYPSKGFVCTDKEFIHTGWIIDNAQDKSKDEYKPVEAEVLWCDLPENPITIEKNCIDSNCKYLTFKVDKSKIANGNAVIAVKNKDKKILWSWHIWFNEKQNTVNLKGNKNTQCNILSENLGWKYSNWYKEEGKEITVILQQGNDENSRVEVTFVRPEKLIVEGECPVYQYFRKDPLSISKQFVTNKKYQTNGKIRVEDSDYRMEKENKNGEMKFISFAYSVSHPNIAFHITNENTGGYNYCWTSVTETKCNYWYGDNGAKTVYDPCPYGYKLPTNEVLTIFPQNGRKFGTDSEVLVFGEKLYLPYNGAYWGGGASASVTQGCKEETRYIGVSPTKYGFASEYEKTDSRYFPQITGVYVYQQKFNNNKPKCDLNKVDQPKNGNTVRPMVDGDAK